MPEKTRKQRIGAWGETLAAAYLTQHGFEVIERNLRTPYGEIDLLARQENLLVFVEVKTRTSNSFGEPELAITTSKKAHMQAAAEHYLQSHPEIEADWRIDVIAIRGRPSDPRPEIVCFENAIS